MSQHTVKAEKDQQTHATLGTQNEDNNNKTTQHTERRQQQQNNTTHRQYKALNLLMNLLASKE
jgi:hypothetical protein